MISAMTKQRQTVYQIRKKGLKHDYWNVRLFTRFTFDHLILESNCTEGNAGIKRFAFGNNDEDRLQRAVPGQGNLIE